MLDQNLIRSAIDCRLGAPRRAVDEPRPQAELTAEADARAADIFRQTQAGRKPREIARDLGLSDSRVRQLASKGQRVAR